MKKQMRIFSVSVLLALAACAAPPPVQPPPPPEPLPFGQTDDFATTAANWREGGPSPNPPRHMAGGGPGGPNDGYLDNVSSGTANSPGRKMIMFNQSQWSGRYLAGSVIRAEVRNLGSTPLALRIGLGSGSSHYVSIDSVPLAPNGDWQTVTFPIDRQSLTRVDGSVSFGQVLLRVTELRILSAGQPQWSGESIEARLGVDNIRLEEGP